MVGAKQVDFKINYQKTGKFAPTVGATRGCPLYVVRSFLGVDVADDLDAVDCCVHGATPESTEQRCPR